MVIAYMRREWILINLMGHNEKDVSAFLAEVFLFLIIASFFSFFTLVPAGKRINDNIFHSDYKGRFIYIMLIISALLFVLSVASVTTSNFNPFIYFRF